jgi:hypothetical protein
MEVIMDIGHNARSDDSTSPPAIPFGQAISTAVTAEPTMIEAPVTPQTEKAGICIQELESNTSVSPSLLESEDGKFDNSILTDEQMTDISGLPASLEADFSPNTLLSGPQSPQFTMALVSQPSLVATSSGMMDFDHSIPAPLLTPMSFEDQSFFSEEEENVEEIMRHSLFGSVDQEPWFMQLSNHASMNPMFPTSDMFGIPRGIDFPIGGPEMLTLRFDRQTCGILSVKDGPTENPWRTLIWPLARDSPALYHAIASMTSFHTSKHQHDELRVQGIDHMRTSIEALANGIASMRFDTAIATTLALAFAESWDQHTSTGINHIKGAKILVNQALTRHRQVAFAGEELERLKFLCNAWVYMDVLARLTSEDDDESNDFDAVYSKLAEPFQGESHLDPLMGAASTLFPIIGRVANLVRRVRRCKSNSPSVISQAMELKKMLQDWDPPFLDEVPEDPSIDSQHTLQTAEAYRWATLLYLHQAVPEIPSETSVELGKKVMVYLATVPLSSRTVIVHIYPLIAASCEAVDDEDRQWVRDRWQSMAQRMKIGVIDRCAEVVKEVWDRRDAYELRTLRKPVSLKRGLNLDIDGMGDCGFDFEWNDPFGGRKRRATNGAFNMLGAMSTDPPRKTSRDASSGEIDYAFTVRGRLHWLGVMKDWGWEGKSSSLLSALTRN